MFGAGSDGSEFPQNSAVRSGFRWSLPLLQVPQKARWTDEYAVTAKTVLCEPFLPQGKTVAGFADRMPTPVSGLGGAAHCPPFQFREIGRGAGRGRVGQAVWKSVVAWY